jgi:hypothetical protein
MFSGNVALHLPVLGDDMNVFVNIFTLCNYCILSNVLDPRIYNFPDIVYGEKASKIHLSQRDKYDYNSLSPDDRHYFSYVRGLAINLIGWLGCHFFFTGKTLSYDASTLARKYLQIQVRTILRYKIAAEKERVGGVPNCTAKALRRQISLLFTGGRTELLGEVDLEDLGTNSLAWKSTLEPSRRRMAVPFCGIISTFIHSLIKY